MLACAASRWPLVLTMYFFPYARKEGKASPFLGSLNGTVLLVSGAVACLCSLVAGPRGLLVLATASCAVALFDLYLKKKLGGVTGDTMGASVELAEIVSLALAVFIF
jgi:adenosylcobinamide-GDP ribazoletransferase